jgi:flagellar motor switch protein FliM
MLSQEEIDNLLRAMAGGDDPTAEEPAPVAEPAAAPAGQPSAFTPSAAVRPVPKIQDKKVRLYDFKNPAIFSRDQMRQVEIIYDNYAKRLSSIMSGRLRTECTITINRIDEIRFQEYNNGLPDSIMMGVLGARPLEGDMLIEINEETAYLIIEKLLGWTGERPLVSEGDFTDIEIKICEKFFIEISEYLKEAWANVADIEPQFHRIETNARLAQIMPFDEIIILVMLDVKMNEYEGRMQICVPCLNLAELLDQAESFMKTKRRTKNEDVEKTKKDIFENLKTSRVDVRGILGNATLSLQDLLYLQVGDVVTLDTLKTNPITLKVGNLDWYQGEIGILKKQNRMAVKIISEQREKKELQKIL